jgi:hypothetical protein
MFIGYNMARRSGLREKDFLPQDGAVNPLRIRNLRRAIRFPWSPIWRRAQIKMPNTQAALN